MAEVAQAPSRWHYITGTAVLLAGIVAFVVFLATGVAGIADSLPQIRVVVPGTHQIYLPKPGNYTIFYEYRSVIANTVYSTGEPLSGISAWMKSEEDSQEVALSAPLGSTSYETRGRAGRSVLDFEIEEAGTYVFSAEYSGNTSGPDIVFAIGQFRLLGGIIGTVLGSLAILFGTLILSGFIIVRTLVKRRQVSSKA